MASTILPEVSRGKRTGVRNSESAFEVHGVAATVRNIKDVDMGAVFAAAFISRRTAWAVLDKSFDYVPYKTGELMASGTIGSASDFGDNDPFGGKLPSASLRGETSYSARSLVEGMTGEHIISSVRVRSGIAMRTFQRYWVGYTAIHANVVHENPYGWEFRQGTGPRPATTKQSHFLLKAYQELEPMFSAAHALALESILSAIHARAEAQKREMKGTLYAGGKPRLIKPGAR